MTSKANFEDFQRLKQRNNFWQNIEINIKFQEKRYTEQQKI